MPDLHTTTAGRSSRSRGEPQHTTRSRGRLSARIATIGGIEVRVHVTFLVLVALVALESTIEGGPGLATGLAWLVGLFSCVVVHELAHSVVARRHGIPIREIELLPIGGVSKMERSPDDPRVELRIAAAGPAASAALAVLLGAIAALAGSSMWPPTLYGGALVARLSWANLMLATFNLIPALPLDGGRVLRALLEESVGRARATHVAARVARVTAGVMIALGLLVNLWLLVIGMFVYFGSWVEESATLLHERVKGLTVGDVMIREPIVLLASTPTARAAERVWEGAQREFPVVDETGGYVGLVTCAQLLSGDAGTAVAQIADRDAPVLSPDDPLESSGLLGGEPAAAAVVSSGGVVGLARAMDAALVAQVLLEQPG